MCLLRTKRAVTVARRPVVTEIQQTHSRGARKTAKRTSLPHSHQKSFRNRMGVQVHALASIRAPVHACLRQPALVHDVATSTCRSGPTSALISLHFETNRADKPRHTATLHVTHKRTASVPIALCGHGCRAGCHRALPESSLCQVARKIMSSAPSEDMCPPHVQKCKPAHAAHVTGRYDGRNRRLGHRLRCAAAGLVALY